MTFNSAILYIPSLGATTSSNLLLLKLESKDSKESEESEESRRRRLALPVFGYIAALVVDITETG